MWRKIIKKIQCMKKYKEIFFWIALILVIQIFMIMLDSAQFLKNEVFHPFRYLYGDGYDSEKFYALEQNMWLINISLYCVMVLSRIVRCREEISYISIIRYNSFRYYYLSVYKSFIIYSISYQIAVFLGALTGYGIVSIYCRVEEVYWYYLLMSQLLLLAGNLFLGVLILYAVLHKHAVKCTLLFYPTIPVIALLSKEYLPQSVNNIIPGNWLMLARSSEFYDGGFDIRKTFIFEVVVFVLVSYMVFNSRDSKE